MTITFEHSEVPVPPGTRFVDTWDNGGGDRRVLLGADRTVTDSDIRVSTTAIQHAAGHIDDGSTDECPKVWIDSDVGLNSDQARELAALLIELAAQIDGWVAR